MINFRKRFKVITKKRRESECTLPPESLHSHRPWQTNFNPESRYVGVMYAGASSIPLVDEIVYFGINAHWDQADIELPGLPPNYMWHLYVDTGRDPEHVICENDNVVLENRHILMQGRTVMIAVAHRMG